MGDSSGKAHAFESLEAIRRWLEGRGFKVSKSTIARHKDEGKIRLDATELQAIAYAKSFLRKSDTGKRALDESADEQRRLLSAKALKEEEAARLLRIKRQREEGHLVPRDRVSQDLAARAVVLKSGLKHMVQSQALAFVHLVGGDPRKAPLLIDELNGRLDALLSGYAASESIVVEFEDEQQEDQLAAVGALAEE